ncbi:hypothetical protein LU293_07040 [Moraxella nasovis]|uniref:hypothetical protein n=1 Tax=Moraxella nasovis TaxID=2904121 RepID=UPI001F606C3A|nr:hypothetical protein [Moraxella nasovis]UNU72847.1 hypothetical protein LU293_07040 [Moraxella nasovis]
MTKILIIGAGKLGLPLAKMLKTAYDVTIVSRSQKPIDGVRQVIKDVATLTTEDFKESFDVVYVILSPSERTILGYLQTYVKTAHPISESVYSPNTHLIYVSSTGVYGQNQGEIVDIHTNPNPATPKDRCLYAAELSYQAFWQHQLTIVRPSGLIAGEISSSKYLVEQALKAASPMERHWLNMVKRQTVIVNLAKMAQLAVSKRIFEQYILNESCQLRHEIYNKIRQDYGLSAITPSDAPVSGKRLVGNFV